MSVIYCNECKNVFISEENSAQRSTVCPKCQKTIDIPSEDELRAKKDEIYLEALHKKRVALYARDLREAKAIFEWLGNYRDAADQVESCEYEAEGIRVKAICDEVLYGRLKAYLEEENG